VNPLPYFVTTFSVLGALSSTTTPAEARAVVSTTTSSAWNQTASSCSRLCTGLSRSEQLEDAQQPLSSTSIGCSLPAEQKRRRQLLRLDPRSRFPQVASRQNKCHKRSQSWRNLAVLRCLVYREGTFALTWFSLPGTDSIPRAGTLLRRLPRLRPPRSLSSSHFAPGCSGDNTLGTTFAIGFSCCSMLPMPPCPSCFLCGSNTTPCGGRHVSWAAVS